MSNVINQQKHEYICNLCDYITCRQSNYKRHLNSYKHENKQMMTKRAKLMTNRVKNEHHECECGNFYKYRQGLHTHRKKCNTYINLLKIKTNEESIIEQELKLIELTRENELLRKNNDLMKENEILKLKNEILRMSKNDQLMKQTFMNSNINNHNITKSQLNFNNKNEIKIFLSEQCSNALSVQDFVKQLTITLDDLMNTKDNTVKGITTIIERNLKPLTLTDRPVHYIKKDEWFLKDKEEWKEDDGDTLVDKTHEKIQKDCIDRYIKDENSNLQDDDTLELLSLITKELEHKNKTKIKDELSNNCVLRNKNNE